MAAKINITGVKGSDLYAHFTGLNPDGTAMDLSGHSVRGFVRFQYGSTGTLLNLSPTINSGSAGEAFVSGLIDVYISGNQLTGLPVTRGYYDIEVYTASHQTGLFNGRFNIMPEITY